jgi:hypothetical protein
VRREVEGKTGEVAYPLRKIHLDAEDSNILWTGTLGLRVKDGMGGRGESSRGSFDSH